VNKKFNELKSAQPDWQEVLLSERVNILKRFSDLLKKNIEPLASVLTSEVGKPLQQSRNEINGLVRVFNGLRITLQSIFLMR